MSLKIWNSKTQAFSPFNFCLGSRIWDHVLELWRTCVLMQITQQRACNINISYFLSLGSGPGGNHPVQLGKLFFSSSTPFTTTLCVIIRYKELIFCISTVNCASQGTLFDWCVLIRLAMKVKLECFSCAIL